MSNWRKAKGLIREIHQCSKCRAEYPTNEFSLEDDECLYCLFPESSGIRPVPMNKSMGFPRNVTGERELLDNLDYVPEKQSKQAKQAYNDYKNRKAYK